MTRSAYSSRSSPLRHCVGAIGRADADPQRLRPAPRRRRRARRGRVRRRAPDAAAGGRSRRARRTGRTRGRARSPVRSTRRGPPPVRRRGRARTSTSPTQKPGRRARRARAKAPAPDATTTSAGATPTTVGSPATHRGRPDAGRQAADQPGRDEIGVAHRPTVQGGLRRRHSGAVPGDPGATRLAGPRRYHDRTVRSPLAALRALSGRIVIAIVLCALVMGAAVFRINRYIDDRIDQIPRVQLTTATASGTATNYLIIGSDTRSFVQSEQDKQAFTDADTTADGPARSDTMMVLHADGDASYVVSFPRDLMVERAGARQPEDQRRVQQGPAARDRHVAAGLQRADQPLPRGELQDLRGHRERGRERAGLLPVRTRATSCRGSASDPFAGLPPARRSAGARLRAVAPPRVLRSTGSGRTPSPRPTSTASSASRTSSRRSGASPCERTLDDPTLAPDLADKVIPNLTVDTGFDRPAFNQLVQAFMGLSGGSRRSDVRDASLGDAATRPAPSSGQGTRSRRGARGAPGASPDPDDHDRARG